jgi:glycosyltransferase involved in cell wall biosynthesis
MQHTEPLYCKDFGPPANDASPAPLRVAVFAYNEQRNIDQSLRRLLVECESFEDARIHVLVNGSTDRTYQIAKDYETRCLGRVVAHDFTKGDKARTWNRYVHDVATDLTQTATHVFMDADVWPARDSLRRMTETLAKESRLAAIGGLPMNGRNRARYCELAKRKRFIYGNLYATRGSWLAWARSIQLRMPVGMVFEDAAVTNAFTTTPEDLRKSDLQRIGHLDGCGYGFTPIRPWHPADVTLYLKRMVRYRLAEKQLARLGWRWPDELPDSMDGINRDVLNELKAKTGPSHPLDRLLIKRLQKQYDAKAA